MDEARITEKIARSSTASGWGKAADQFEKEWKNLLGASRKQQAAKLSPIVAKLIERMKGRLPGYDFAKGASSKSVADRFLREVFLDNPEDPQWTFDNFFRQGYMMLEPAPVDLNGAQAVLRGVLNGIARKFGGGKYNVSDSDRRKNSVMGEVTFEHKDAWMNAMDEIDAQANRAFKLWSRQNGVAEPSIWTDIEKDDVLHVEVTF